MPGWAVDQLLDRFTELGLVDDEAYARAWVRSRHAGRGMGRRALRYELVTRGVDRDTVDEALAEVSADDEEAAARALVQQKLASMARLDRATRYRRLVGLLGRRGYSAGTASRVVAAVLADADALGDGALVGAEEDIGP